jgi:hypothetical protein
MSVDVRRQSRHSGVTDGGTYVALTVAQAKNAKPGRHSDGKGLYLLVKPGGTKSWVLRVQHNGRRQDFGLGTFAANSLDVPIRCTSGDRLPWRRHGKKRASVAS